jgi:hypothetical protein
VVHCGKWAKMAVPQEQVEFYFDRHAETNYNAGVLLAHIASLKYWDCSSYLSPGLNIVSRSAIGIQAVDLLARETMKHLDNMIGPVKRPPRQSLMTLRASNRFGFDFHMREFFEDFKRKFEAVALELGMSAEQYHAWLIAHGQAHSISSLHRYIIDLDNADLKA